MYRRLRVCADDLNAPAVEWCRATIEVGGWVFRPDGELPAVKIWIDGQPVGISLPREPRPYVLSAFPTVPAAERSGFSLGLAD
jgi:hypothetical protein